LNCRWFECSDCIKFKLFGMSLTLKKIGRRIDCGRFYHHLIMKNYCQITFPKEMSRTRIGRLGLGQLCTLYAKDIYYKHGSKETSLGISSLALHSFSCSDFRTFVFLFSMEKSTMSHAPLFLCTLPSSNEDMSNVRVHIYI
jgi:hypothetical protein